ncbi:MAG: ABC-type dipeptide/oligopeptide/nickel transport system permease component, partial [Myxococcota bacterium]
MLRYILRRLVGAVVVIFAVFTLSFLIMRVSPGSPFDEEKELPAEVVAGQAAVTGMAIPIDSPVTGLVIEIKVEKNQHIMPGDVLAIVDVDGEHRPIKAEEEFEVFRVIRKRSERIEKGRPLLFRKTTMISQYFTTLSNYAQFDFGVTFDSKGQRTVAENIKETLPVSMELGLYALFIALVFGVTSGLIAGLKQNTWLDHSIMSLAMLGISVPAIVLGPLMILVFIMQTEWLPAYGGWEGGFFVGWEKKILPAFALGLPYAAYFARLTRGGMLEVVRQDWMRTARAKGLPDSLIVRRHALKGAILPSVTFL